MFSRVLGIGFSGQIIILILILLREFIYGTSDLGMLPMSLRIDDNSNRPSLQRPAPPQTISVPRLPYPFLVKSI